MKEVAWKARTALLAALSAWTLAACQRERSAAADAAPTPPVAPATTPPAAPPPSYEARLAAAGWVGSAPCADCHADIAASFARSAMARAITRPRSHALLPPGRAAHAGEGLAYEAVTADGIVRQVETRADAAGLEVFREQHDASLVIGSGAHTLSFLGFGDGGALFQLPLTWYRQSARWDLSPGYTEFNRRFDRPAGPECLFCHNLTPVPHADVRAGGGAGWLGIGCERCHGPGRDHVADPSVKPFHPGRASPEEEQRVCDQCHLTGAARVFAADWDLLPPDPAGIDRVLSVFVPATSADGDGTAMIAGQGDRLRRSACFTRSEGKMRCTTCHDPHRPADTGAAWYRERCQSCHAPDACAAPAGRAADADCVACHLQRAAAGDVPHTRATDHWIRRRLPAAPAALKGAGEEQAPATDPAAGVRFAHEPRGLAGAEARARLGTARLRVADQHHFAPLLFEAEADLKAAAAEAPENALALAGLGHIAALMHRWDEAAGLLERAVALAPRLVGAGRDLGAALVELSRPGDAAATLAALVEKAPEPAEVLLEQAHAHAKGGEAEAAVAALRRAVALRPSLGLLRRELATLLAQIPDPRGARDELVEACRRSRCDVETLRGDAALLVNFGHAAEAVEVLEAGLRDHPADDALNAEIARLADEHGLAEAKVRVRGRAFDRNPGDVDAALAFGAVLFDAGQADKAAKVYERALKTGGPKVPLLRQLGVARGVSGRMPEAEDLLRRAVALDGGRDASLLNELGMAQRGLNRRRDAIATFRRATRADPKFAFAWFNLALDLQAEKRNDEALAAVEKGLSVAPDDERALALRRDLLVAVHGTDLDPAVLERPPAPRRP
jgi:tetratricopeptide (TPR) repeat protein